MNKTKRILKKSALYTFSILPIVTMLSGVVMLFVSEAKSANYEDKYETKEAIVREYTLTDEFKEKQKSDKENIELAHELGVISDKDYKEKILNLTTIDYAIDLANKKEEFKDDLSQMEEYKKDQLAWGGASLISATAGIASAIVTVKKVKNGLGLQSHYNNSPAF